jgi:protein-L-isoaspartate(D-aspartate) O-methyltransferase
MEDPIDKAFKDAPRQNFLPEEVRGSAGLDIPLPIGSGQTNSQPTTVAMMLRWLAVEPGDEVLDVGSGSGWTSALLASLTGRRGKVHAVELLRELMEFGQGNCQRLGIRNIRFHQAGRDYGWSAEAPYDRILVSAAANEMPAELLDQLKAPGRMVVPVQGTVYVIEKDDKGNVTEREEPGFMFVPLVRG